MNISILGATGSIGRQAFEVVQNLPGVKVHALAAYSDYKTLAGQAKILRPALAAMYDENAALELKKLLPGTQVAAGMEGILQCASIGGEGDLVLNAMVGSIGLKPTLAAIAAKKDVALANKETLVAGGSLVMKAAKANNVEIRPIDSEHSAIWQCLQGSKLDSVKRLILTASGGAFRALSKDEISKATANQALKHPNWNMGPKITVDCATMMNKGLEYIEAHWLFNMPYDKIDVLVHPQSIIHSMVEFEDGAVLAQMAAPDMCQPIQYALCAPDRIKRPHRPLDFLTLGQLTFEGPDFDRFPCLALAMHCAKVGGTLPAVMNSVNEHLVAAFLKDAIGFYDISRIIEKAVSTYTVKPVKALRDIEEAEAWAVEFCKRSF